MHRREFLERLAQLGLVLATPKLIFDMGAHKSRIVEYIPIEPLYSVEMIKCTKFFELAYHSMLAASFESFNSDSPYNVTLPLCEITL